MRFLINFLFRLNIIITIIVLKSFYERIKTLRSFKRSLNNNLRRKVKTLRKLKRSF